MTQLQLGLRFCVLTKSNTVMSIFKQLFNKDQFYLRFGDSFVVSTECEKNLKIKSFACFSLDFAFISAFLAFISFSRCWYEQVGSFVKKCSFSQVRKMSGKQLLGKCNVLLKMSK